MLILQVAFFLGRKYRWLTVNKNILLKLRLYQWIMLQVVPISLVPSTLIGRPLQVTRTALVVLPEQLWFPAVVSSLHPTANLSLTCCLTGSDIYISLYLSPLRDFCMKNILVWPIYHWALTHVAPSKKYPLLLNHKNCSFASSDAPNSFQPFKTDILLNHKKKSQI